MPRAHLKLTRVMEEVCQRIATGRLKPGDKLASIRAEAAELGVAKNTVVEAYFRLAAQGWVKARPGSGYYVTDTARPPARRSASAFQGIPDTAALLTEQLEQRLAIRPGDGRLPAHWLADSDLRNSLGRRRLQSADAYNYNTAYGYARLRERLTVFMAARGIDCLPDQILTTHGANHAMDLVIRAFVRSASPVLVDEPGYYPLFAKLDLAGATTLGVRRTMGGPDLEDFERQARTSGARIFFTQSLAHNPTGGSITLARAHALLKIAARHDILIVEDDPFADIIAAQTPRLASLDQLEQVIYIGSFSKTLAGSFRSGYVAATRERIDVLSRLLMNTIVSTSSHNERLILALMSEGLYLKHLRSLGDYLRVATARTIAGLERCGVAFERPHEGSFYIWAKLPEPRDESRLIASAAAEDIFIAPSRIFYLDADQPTQHLRINVAHGADPRFLDWLSRQVERADADAR